MDGKPMSQDGQMVAYRMDRETIRRGLTDF